MEHLRKYFPKLLLVVLSVGVLWKGILPGFNQINWDFPNYYIAAQLFSEGHDVALFYDNDWFLEQADKYDGIYAKFTPFPPSTVFIMYPLSGFSMLLAKQIWTVLNACVLLGLIAIIRKITLWSWINATLIVLTSGFSLINNFYLGQFYLILTFLLFLGYYWDQQGKSLLSGSMFALGILFKYLPVVYLPIYLLKNRSTFFLALGTLLVMMGVVIGVVGWNATITFIDQVFLAHLQGEIAGQESQSIAFQSWGALFKNLFELEKAKILTYVVTGGVLVIYLLMIERLWKVKAHYNYLLAFTGCTFMLLLPASASYHFLLLIFPIVVLLAQLQSDRLDPPIKVILILYIAIGWFNIGYTRILWDLDHFLAILGSFPRLWLMFGLWMYVFYVLKRNVLDAYKVKISQ